MRRVMKMEKYIAPEMEVILIEENILTDIVTTSKVEGDGSGNYETDPDDFFGAW